MNSSYIRISMCPSSFRTRGSVVLLAAALDLCCSPLHAEPTNQAGSEPSFVPQHTERPTVALSSLRTRYLPIFEQHAKHQEVPVELVDAVAFVESSYNAGARGSAGEIGLMQLMPGTAALLGFAGNGAELAQPETNIRLGVQYLAGALRRASGDLCRALMKYRAGHGEETMSGRSLQYCRRVRDRLAAIGSPLAAAVLVPVPSQTSSSAAAKGRPSFGTIAGDRRQRTAARGQQFWAAHEARIRAMSLAVRAKWDRLSQKAASRDP
jgi:Transglycosylase SLT domain